MLKRKVMTDGETIKRVLSGDVEAFRHIVERYWRHVLALVRQRLGASADVEDVLQETFIKAYRKLGQLRDPTRLRMWLMSIAQKACVDHVRKRRGSVLGEEGAALAAADGASEGGLSEEVRRVVESLPALYREVVMLRFAGGMSCKEIADYLGEPAGTVRNRLFRANEMLRRRLKRAVERGS